MPFAYIWGLSRTESGLLQISVFTKYLYLFIFSYCVLVATNFSITYHFGLNFSDAGLVVFY